MKSVVLKWFDKLSFPKEWRSVIEDNANTALSGDIDFKNHRDFLIKSLYDCEKLSDFYVQKGIDEKILMHTLSDLLIWAKNYNLMTGKIGINEHYWIGCHLSGRLFRLGRLQFCKGVMECDCERLSLKKGDPIIEVHIPQGEPLLKQNCEASVIWAKEFFSKYFPDYKYSCFTCHSWLLDYELKEFLKPESNIIEFQNMFDIIGYDESNQAIKYLFDINPEKNVQSYLQKKILEHTSSGGKLHEGYGIIK